MTQTKLNLSKEELERMLFQYFGYPSFRKGQFEIIQSVLSGRDTIVIQSTGGGKSLCYQFPSLLFQGITIVISPLISLMEDQVREARKFGRKDVTCLHSGLSTDERMYILNRLKQYNLLYISPEGIQGELVIGALQRRGVSLYVVDEAHCISQWGHDFRFHYLKLSQVRQQLKNPHCLALTATATNEVKRDMIQYLQLQDYKEFTFSIDRPNIAIKVEKVMDENEKQKKIVEFLLQRKDEGMIYFSSRAKAEQMVQLLMLKGFSQVAYYHSGMSNLERNLIQQQFLDGELKIICATNAFGMGVNKPNIRFVIHYHFPSHIESYVQEMGRCSRDGKPGLSYLFIQEGDEQIPYHFMEQELLNDHQLNELVAYLRYSSQVQQSFTIEDLARRLGCPMQALQIVFIQLERLKVFQEMKGLENQELSPPTYLSDEVEQNLYDKIEQIRQTKRKKIAEMYFWTNLSEGACRRKHLLRSFSEDTKEIKAFPCCDLCGLPGEWLAVDIDIDRGEELIRGMKPTTWREKVDRLWPIK